MVHQIGVPEAPRFSKLAHESTVDGNSGPRKISAKLQRQLYRRQTAMDVSITVSKCGKCSRNWFYLRKKTNFLQLFPAKEPLVGIVFAILGPFPKYTDGRRFILFITDCFIMLTKSVILRHIEAWNVPREYDQNWISNMDPPRRPSKTTFFIRIAVFRKYLRVVVVSQNFKITYFPHTNQEAKRYNRNIV